jgi:hypothetical protein
MPNKVFVSPGVYTSEKDLSFVTSQIGVTTLGLVGETTIGPAFQPIFISSYDEFKNFFGQCNATKVKDNNAPLYELPYIAKEYLNQSNQLFVTRVLGLSGFEAGQAWGITLDAALDLSTTATTTTTSYSPLLSFTATSANTNVTIVSNDPLLQQIINSGDLDDTLATLSQGPTGTTYVVTGNIKNNGLFSGLTTTMYLNNIATVGAFITGTTTGVTVHYTGTGYSDTEDKLVALLRSRGGINGDTQLPAYEITGTTNGPTFVSSITAALTDPLAEFSLSGTSNTQGKFNYSLSLDNTKKSYLPKVLGRTNNDGKTAVFAEEFFEQMFDTLDKAGKIRGINQTMIKYSNSFNDYKQEYKPAVTPYVVSELRGTKVLRLFRFWTISDGNAANEQFKISIRNIKLDTKEFDIVVRAFGDNDTQPTVLESFSRVTMDPTSVNYVARRIGTLDGNFPSKSSYVLIELDDTNDTSEAFPAGFVGYPMRNYQAASNSGVVSPNLLFQTAYGEFDTSTVIKKKYLGLSDLVGIDADFFDHKGVEFSALTKGFHMDVDAASALIDNQAFSFEVGAYEFRSEAGVLGTKYEKIRARKFSFVPFGGFDGWDIYRTRRSNLDSFLINGTLGSKGKISGAFKSRTLFNGDAAINSDYYAYLEAIWTFKNPEAVNVNVFATPGIDVMDNGNLVEEAIDMVENDRADSLYIVTTPDTDGGGDVMTAGDIADFLDGTFDSNYTCTYWPWIQVDDTENNVYIWMPATRDVVRNIAFTDKKTAPWYAVAGIERGTVNAVQARKKLTLDERDILYDARINPIATFTTEGIKIWGNKTLQIKDTALNRINVRRLLLQARKLISAVSIRLLFEQNDAAVRNQFLSLVNPILDSIRSQRGLTDFRVVLSNDPEDFDRNQLTGQIFLKPTRALEFIQLEFVIMNTGASFDNV